jgi:hypothetical protein
VHVAVGVLARHPRHGHVCQACHRHPFMESLQGWLARAGTVDKVGSGLCDRLP